MAGGDWSRRGERPGRRRRLTMVVELRRHLVRTGVVDSLCWASWGWCRITIWVFVGMGWAGRDSQRHTGLGREQLLHMVRRGGDEVEVPERSRPASSMLCWLVTG